KAPGRATSELELQGQFDEVDVVRWPRRLDELSSEKVGVDRRESQMLGDGVIRGERDGRADEALVAAIRSADQPAARTVDAILGFETPEKVHVGRDRPVV